MKKLSFVFSVFVLLLFLFGCDGSGADDPKPKNNTATFRVDYSQTGDYQKFIKIITIGVGDFKYSGTNDDMPPVLMGDNLNAASFSVEGKNLEKLEISSLTSFSAVEDGPASMTMKFMVYKNNKLLEEKSFTYTETTEDRAEQLNYTAN